MEEARENRLWKGLRASCAAGVMQRRELSWAAGLRLLGWVISLSTSLMESPCSYCFTAWRWTMHFTLIESQLEIHYM